MPCGVWWVVDKRFSLGGKRMKRSRLIFLLLVIVSLLSIAASVEKTVGEQLSLSPAVNPGPEITFEANKPFHITHGYWWNFFY